MTLLERLQSHKGSLIKLKTELFWYGGRGWDENPGRVCLILDAARGTIANVATAGIAAGTRGGGVVATLAARVAALLLIDGSPQWVWVAEADVELL